MSDDLISRKQTEQVLKKCISDISHTQRGYESENEILETVGILKAISCIINPEIVPTVYDVDKVIGQLKNIKTDNSCRNCIYKEKCDELQEFYNPDDSVDLCGLTIKELAIEIVRYGGVAND